MRFPAARAFGAAENIFAVLPYYIEQEEVSLARAECQMVKNTAEHIQKTERIAFENVF